MKNQFFGDSRNMFKFHLVLHTMESLPHLKTFTYVPMLTPNDDSGQGGRTDYPRPPCHEHLYESLQQAVKTNRDIRSLGEFFANKPFRYYPYKDDAEFKESERAAYFHEIPAEALQDALILLDPDTGLEVKRRANQQYLRYLELKQALGRAGEKSALMVFQYFRYPNDELSIEKIRARVASELSNLSTTRVTKCHEDNVAFFFAVKDQGVFDELEAIIANYPKKRRSA